MLNQFFRVGLNTTMADSPKFPANLGMNSHENFSASRQTGSQALDEGIKRRWIEDPFYPVTWRQALQDYQDGILTPRGLIYCYFVVHLRPGVETHVDVDELCRLLEIGTATYYRAIGALKAKKRLNIRRGKMLVGIPEIPLEPLFSQLRESNSQLRESNSQLGELDSQLRELDSQLRENGNELEASQDGDFLNFENVPNKQKKFKETNKLGTDPPTHPVLKGIDRKGIGTGERNSLEADIERLSALIQQAGARPNKTIQQAIASLLIQEGSARAAQAVENSISALQEQQEKGTVRNPGGFIVAALRRHFTANQAKKQARVHRQGKSQPISLNQEEMQIDSYLMSDRRDWALTKLQSLWSEGWHDQVEELLQLRRDWGFAVTEGGVIDAGS